MTDNILEKKLFEVTYMDKYGDNCYFTVGDSQKDVLEKESKILSETCNCYYGCWVKEFSSVDGYKIILEKEDLKE
jgi:hypothetical protein